MLRRRGSTFVDRLLDAPWAFLAWIRHGGASLRLRLQDVLDVAAAPFARHPRHGGLGPLRRGATAIADLVGAVPALVRQARVRPLAPRALALAATPILTVALVLVIAAQAPSIVRAEGDQGVLSLVVHEESSPPAAVEAGAVRTAALVRPKPAAARVVEAAVRRGPAARPAAAAPARSSTPATTSAPAAASPRVAAPTAPPRARPKSPAPDRPRRRKPPGGSGGGGDQPKADEPKADDPAPKGDEPKGDEPKDDEPKDDEPKGDEPKDEEPKDEDRGDRDGDRGDRDRDRDRDRGDDDDDDDGDRGDRRERDEDRDEGDDD